MRMGNSHRHDDSKDKEVTWGVCGILDKGVHKRVSVTRRVGTGSDFKSENGRFAEI